MTIGDLELALSTRGAPMRVVYARDVYWVTLGLVQAKSFCLERAMLEALEKFDEHERTRNG